MVNLLNTWVKDVSITVSDMIWASTQENLPLGLANNNGADQPAHSRRLVSTFVVGLSECIISKLDTSEISQF